MKKNGDYDSAIDIYENDCKILDHVGACHDRLMIIYRNMKKYDDEIHVIRRHIELKEKEEKFFFRSENYTSAKWRNLRKRLERAEKLTSKSKWL